MIAKADRDNIIEDAGLALCGPIREIVDLYLRGKISAKQIKAFVEGRNPFEAAGELAVENAQRILGWKKVITAQQAASAFNCPVPALQPMPYSDSILRECAILNKWRHADWRLVFSLPLSLLEQRQTLAGDQLFNGESYRLEDDHSPWARIRPAASYHLIDFRGRFNACDWMVQNSLIMQFSRHVERADERVVSQALIAIYRVHNIRMFKNQYHRGLIQDGFGSQVCVGYFEADGLDVRLFPLSASEKKLCACLAWR
jgi:hypothetical protein